MLGRLLRMFSKAEGQPRPGPWLTSQGVLPAAWGQWMNWWQMGYNPLGAEPNAIVEACVWAYIRAIAQLPGLHRFNDEAEGEQEIVTTSALSRLLRSPNDYQTSSDFLGHIIRSLLLTGNSYSIAQRNDRNEVVALHWTNPRHCHVQIVPVEGQAFAEVFYTVGENPLLNITDSTQLVIPARDVLHIKLATPRHPLIGESWLCALAVELANRGAVNASMAVFFQNMARPSGVLYTDENLTPQQIADLRQKWNEQTQGANAGGTPILANKLKWQDAHLSNADSQVIDTLKLSDRTIAAVFGVPAVLVGIGEAGTPIKSTEAVINDWLASGLGFLLNHIEVAIDKFIGLPRTEYTEYDTSALLRSAFLERMDGLVKGVQGGVFSPNEARNREGLKSVKFGDEPRVQQQVVPLSFASKPPPPPAAPVQPPKQDAAPGDQPATGDKRLAELVDTVIAAKMQRRFREMIEGPPHGHA